MLREVGDKRQESEQDRPALMPITGCHWLMFVAATASAVSEFFLNGSRIVFESGLVRNLKKLKATENLLFPETQCYQGRNILTLNPK